VNWNKSGHHVASIDYRIGKHQIQSSTWHETSSHPYSVQTALRHTQPPTFNPFSGVKRPESWSCPLNLI